MRNTIPLGLRHSLTIPVSQSLTVPAVSPVFTGFSNMPPVFVTAYMIGFIEWVCIEALKPYLTPSQRTVGTHVNVNHCAATPVGMNVTAEVELIACEGKHLAFKIICRDEVDIISEGQHERFIIDVEKFTARANGKNQPSN